MLGGVVVELQQRVQFIGNLGDGLGPLGPIVGVEGFDRSERSVIVLCTRDFIEGPFGGWLCRFWGDN